MCFCVCAKTNPFKLSLSLCLRPQNGSMILYNRKKVKYRKDGYCWKKRKDGKTTREDHMKLKVQGVEVRGCSLLVTRYNHKLSWKTSWKHKLSNHEVLCASSFSVIRLIGSTGIVPEHAIEEKTGVYFFPQILWWCFHHVNLCKRGCVCVCMSIAHDLSKIWTPTPPAAAPRVPVRMTLMCQLRRCPFKWRTVMKHVSSPCVPAHCL